MISVWLRPAPPLESALAGHIRRICAALGCAPHLPHVTVLGDLRIAPGATTAALHQLETRLPLVLRPEGIRSSERRFEALAVRFQASAAFEALVAELRRALGSAAAGPEPHLSLAYPEEPFDPAALPALAQGVPLDVDYRFDRLAIVDAGPGRTDWHDVAAWRLLGPEPDRG